MKGQTELVTRETQTLPKGPCAWCGTMTDRKIELEKARWHKDRMTGLRVPAKQAVTAWVCDTHDRTLVRSGDAETGESAPVLK